MAPKPIKGKPYNRQMMFGGQLTLLLKQVETGNKCGKQMGQNKNSNNTTNGNRGRRVRPDFKRRNAFPSSYRGARQQQHGQFRQRFQRPGTGWTDNNRVVQQGYRSPLPAAAGKPPNFQRGGSK